MTDDATRVTSLTGTAPEVVPVGIHDATFDHVELMDTQFGERLRWVFNVGDMTISKFTSLSINEKSKAGAIIVALGAEVPKANMQANVQALEGRRCQLVVVPGKGDYTQIETVAPAKAQPVAVSDDDGFDEWAQSAIPTA